jgi:hypothetical protein
MKEVVLYPMFALTAILGFITGGSFYAQSSHNETLKMCNQKPNECKFKYDILMYNETGRVPYALPNPESKPVEEKK